MTDHENSGAAGTETWDLSKVNEVCFHGTGYLGPQIRDTALVSLQKYIDTSPKDKDRLQKCLDFLVILKNKNLTQEQIRKDVGKILEEMNAASTGQKTSSYCSIL